jgi:hypothetical protein
VLTTATFDTLKFANTLKAAGVPDKQAEAEASVLGEALAVNFKELVTNDELHGSLRETEQRLPCQDRQSGTKVECQDRYACRKVRWPNHAFEMDARPSNHA